MRIKDSRVRVRDAETAIFRPNADVQGDEPDREFGTDLERQIEVYTIYGKHDYLDGDDMPCLGDESEDVLAEDRPLAFAKSVSVNGRNPHYYIRRASDGRFYNPIGMYEGGNHNKFIHKAGRREYEYHEVGSQVFDLYLMFLKTKNTAYLRNAERENF